MTLSNPVHSSRLAPITAFDVLELEGDLDVHWGGVGEHAERQSDSF